MLCPPSALQVAAAVILLIVLLVWCYAPALLNRHERERGVRRERRAMQPPESGLETRQAFHEIRARRTALVQAIRRTHDVEGAEEWIDRGLSVPARASASTQTSSDASTQTPRERTTARVCKEQMNFEKRSGRPVGSADRKIPDIARHDVRRRSGNPSMHLIAQSSRTLDEESEGSNEDHFRRSPRPPDMSNPRIGPTGDLARHRFGTRQYSSTPDLNARLSTPRSPPDLTPSQARMLRQQRQLQSAANSSVQIEPYPPLPPTSSPEEEADDDQEAACTGEAIVPYERVAPYVFDFTSRSQSEGDLFAELAAEERESMGQTVLAGSRRSFPSRRRFYEQ